MVTIFEDPTIIDAELKAIVCLGFHRASFSTYAP